MDFTAVKYNEIIVRGNYSKILKAVAKTEQGSQEIIVKRVNNTARKTFLREIAALQYNANPGIIRLYGYDNKKKEMYLEDLTDQGISISRYIDHNGKLTPKEALPLLSSISKSLAYIHTRTTEKPAFIHYDISDNNVFILNVAETKIIDFGTSFEDGGYPAEHDTWCIGTPRYNAPEKITKNRNKETTAVDVYAFGILGYKMLVGIEPFTEMVGSLNRQICFDSPAPINSTHKPLDNILMDCLAKDPRQRPSMDNIYTQLEQYR